MKKSVFLLIVIMGFLRLGAQENFRFGRAGQVALTASTRLGTSAIRFISETDNNNQKIRYTQGRASVLWFPVRYVGIGPVIHYLGYKSSSSRYHNWLGGPALRMIYPVRTIYLYSDAEYLFGKSFWDYYLFAPDERIISHAFWRGWSLTAGLGVPLGKAVALESGPVYSVFRVEEYTNNEYSGTTRIRLLGFQATLTVYLRKHD